MGLGGRGARISHVGAGSHLHNLVVQARALSCTVLHLTTKGLDLPLRGLQQRSQCTRIPTPKVLATTLHRYARPTRLGYQGVDFGARMWRHRHWVLEEDERTQQCCCPSLGYHGTGVQDRVLTARRASRSAATLCTAAARSRASASFDWVAAILVCGVYRMKRTALTCVGELASPCAVLGQTNMQTRASNP